jgi:hypothetical protein
MAGPAACAVPSGKAKLFLSCSFRWQRPGQRRQVREVDTLRQARLQIVDDAPKLPRRQTTAVGGRLRWTGLRRIGQEP